jgi:hypothetical protein
LLNLSVGAVSLVVPRVGDREKGSVLLSLAGTTITNGIYSGRTETDPYVMNKMEISVKGCSITIDHKTELVVPEEYRSMLKLDDIAINLDLVIENNLVNVPSDLPLPLWTYSKRLPPLPPPFLPPSFPLF